MRIAQSRARIVGWRSQIARAHPLEIRIGMSHFVRVPNRREFKLSDERASERANGSQRLVGKKSIKIMIQTITRRFEFDEN